MAHPYDKRLSVSFSKGSDTVSLNPPSPSETDREVATTPDRRRVESKPEKRRSLPRISGRFGIPKAMSLLKRSTSHSEGTPAVHSPGQTTWWIPEESHTADTSDPSRQNEGIDDLPPVTLYPVAPDSQDIEDNRVDCSDESDQAMDRSDKQPSPSVEREDTLCVRQLRNSFKSASKAATSFQAARRRTDTLTELKRHSDEVNSLSDIDTSDNQPEATDIPDDVVLALRSGLLITDSKAMPQALADYALAVGRCVRAKVKLTPTQQRLLRNGYVELLAHDQELNNPYGIVHKKTGGISRGKLAIAMRLDMLEQVRESIRSGGSGMATQISGVANLGPLEAFRRDMLGCKNQPEFVDLVFSQGMNIDLFCISGHQKDIQKANVTVTDKTEKLIAEKTKPSAQQNEEEISRLEYSIATGKKFISETQQTLDEKLRTFKEHATCHLDQLFIEVATLQEQMRRESLPGVLDEMVQSTSGRSNREKYLHPETIVSHAHDELMKGARLKVMGHTTENASDVSEAQLQKNIDTEFQSRSRKVWLACHELLLNSLGLDRYKAQIFESGLSDNDRMTLRDHLISNIPVNIPLAHKKKVLEVGQRNGIISLDSCDEEQFQDDLEYASSPFKPDLLIALAEQEPETFSYLLNAVNPDYLTSDELDAIYQGCKALLSNRQVAPLLTQGRLKIYGAQADDLYPELKNTLIYQAQEGIKKQLKTMRGEGDTDIDYTPDGIQYIAFTKYKTFDHANPVHQLLQALSYGLHILAGVQSSAGMKARCSDSLLSTSGKLTIYKTRLTAYGQELLNNTQPELKNGTASQRLLICENGLPGKCVVNTGPYQVRGALCLDALLASKAKESSQ